MRKIIYSVLFWPGFVVGWLAQCVILGYEAGRDSFGAWCVEYTEKGRKP